MFLHAPWKPLSMLCNLKQKKISSSHYLLETLVYVVDFRCRILKVNVITTVLVLFSISLALWCFRLLFLISLTILESIKKVAAFDGPSFIYSVWWVQWTTYHQHYFSDIFFINRCSLLCFVPAFVEFPLYFSLLYVLIGHANLQWFWIRR